MPKLASGTTLNGSRIFIYRPMSGNPDSGSWEIFARGIRNPALESGTQFKESRIPLRTVIQNLVSGIRNPQHGIQNPRLYWICLQSLQKGSKG